MADKDASHDLEALIGAAQDGDDEARDLLIQRHYPWILSAIRLQIDARLRRKESCADLAQSLCVEVLEHLDDFEYRGEGSFRSWLYAWIKNIVRNRQRYYRADKRDMRREVSEAGATQRERLLLECYASFCTPSRQAMIQDELHRIEEEMDRLPGDYREVIIQAQLMGLPHAEIARRMERSPEATRKLLHRAMARLAAALSKGGSSV